MNKHSDRFSRIRQCVIEHDTGVIINNTRGMDNKQRKAMKRVLLANIRKEGYSVTKLKGRKEESLFVVDINNNGRLSKTLESLKERFNYTFLFSPKGKDMPFLGSIESIGEELYPPNNSLGRWGLSIIAEKDWETLAEEIED